MSDTAEKSSTTPALAQNLIIMGMAWGGLGLLFFFYSILLSQKADDLPLWYQIGTYVIELSAYLGSSLLCLRNWRNPQMVSGKNVWLWIGAGMFFYFMGGLLFGCWELIWGLDPQVSLGDFCYVITYICLGAGMVLAISSKRMELEGWQWGVLATVAIAGISLGTWVASPTMFGLIPSAQAAPLTQWQPSPISLTSPLLGNTVTAPVVSEQFVSEQLVATAPEAVEEETSESSAPSWIMALDETLKPIAYVVNLFYIIGDVFLLIIATALLMAFWGGRFSQSWRMIAAGTFSLYVADMYFKWADTQAEGSYQSGSLPEIFFVFSAILFGIGAILEYDISTRSRQSRRGRRTASA